MISKARLASHNHDMRRPTSGDRSGNSSDASSPPCFSSRSGQRNFYPRPMTHWAGEYPDELMRAFFAQVTMEARLRNSTKPPAPTSLITFLAAAFQIPPLRSTSPLCHGASDAVKGCLVPCASRNSPSSLPMPDVVQLIRTTSCTENASPGFLDGTGKQMLNLVARSTMCRNSNTGSSESATTKRSSPTV